MGRGCHSGTHTFLFWKIVFALAMGELGGLAACERGCKRSLPSATSQVTALGASIRFCTGTQSHELGQEGCHFYNDKSSEMKRTSFSALARGVNTDMAIAGTPPKDATLPAVLGRRFD